MFIEMNKYVSSRKILRYLQWGILSQVFAYVLSYWFIHLQREKTK